MSPGGVLAVRSAATVIEQWLPAVLAVAAWPAAVEVMVLVVVALVPSTHQVAVLAGMAETCAQYAVERRTTPVGSAAGRRA
ncbi:hypothetical protein [Pseudonocardia sp. GCM10023141]|uniref:hypothetical protein n=1 Tax=Pseudonocardia sp. GCM10023141 TaxID=3252653 RepID=UPI00361BB1B5